jgi:transcription initiation factor IIE alpha subunit
LRRQFPVAWCPTCGRAVFFSSDPKMKTRIKVRPASENETGEMFLCSKCKTMLVKEETHPHVVTIPCLGYVEC